MTQFEKIKPDDVTYTNVDSATWSVIEQSLGITCACLPTLRQLFGRLFSGGTEGSDSRSLENSGQVQLPELNRRPKSLEEEIT